MTVIAEEAGAVRSVRSTAPVRVADVGGWTDTWFGSPGQVCHLAVGPGVQVDAALVEADPSADRPVRLVAPRIGADHRVGPSPERGWAQPVPAREPLLEHAVGAILSGADLPPGAGVEVVIESMVPPGASLGTSASVVVAVLGALDALAAGGRRSPQDLARLAHRVETERAGREAGVQDQWAAAMGGAELLAVGPYPETRHQPVALDGATTAALSRRLLTVVFEAHDSSAVHGEVSHALLSCDGDDHSRSRAALRRLSALAADAASALRSSDVDGWADVLTAATAAQADLHPGLVGASHRAAIDDARALGAVGWKVNGAGGAGGSLTAVAPASADARGDWGRALVETWQVHHPHWQVVDLTPAPGLAVSRTER